MGDVTATKGLRDLRTATTTRLHAKPPQKGTAHLDLYLLGKEKERLEKELTRLEQRRRHLREHLAEICQAMEELGVEAQREMSPQEPGRDLAAGDGQPLPALPYGRRPWKRVPHDY